MLALGPAAADLIRAVTGSAADVEATISYVTYSNVAPPVVQLVDGEPLASITTATSTTLLTGATNTYTVIKGINLYNRSATPTTLRLEHEDGGVHTVGLVFCTLLQDEALVYTESGLWLHYDANGAIYPSVGNAATQAEMEAGTATDKYVTPQGVNWHPGAMKFWVKAGVTGNNLASWNITSLTDTGTGVLTITIATDFSSVDYCISVSVEATGTTWAVANSRECHIRSATIAVGSVAVDCIDNTVTTNLVKDPTSWHVCGLGDQ